MTQFVQDPIITALKKTRLTCRWLQDYKPKKPSLLQKIEQRSPKILSVQPELIVAIDWTRSPAFKQQFTVVLAELKLNFRTTFYVETIAGFKAINPLEISASLLNLLTDSFPFYDFSNTPSKNHPPIKYLVGSGHHLLKEVISDSEPFRAVTVESLEYLSTNSNIYFRNSQDLKQVDYLRNTMTGNIYLSPLLQAARNCLSGISNYFQDSKLDNLFQKAIPKDELIDLTPAYSDLPALKAVIAIDRNLTEKTTITCLVAEGNSRFRLLKPTQWQESKPKSLLIDTYLPVLVKELESTYSEELNLDHKPDITAKFKSQEIIILSTDRTLVNDEPKVQFVDVRADEFLFDHWIAIAKGILSENQMILIDYLDKDYKLTFNQIVPKTEKPPTVNLNLRQELFRAEAPESLNPAVLGLLVCLAGLHQ